MKWVIQFLVCCVAVSAFSFSWLVSVGIGDFAWVMHSTWVQVIIAIGLMIVGFILSNISTNYLGLIGLGICAGAVIGCFVPLYRGVVGWFEYVSGFWMYALAWFILVLLLAASASAFTAALKATFISLLRFDFITSLIGCACTIVAIYCSISVIAGSFANSTGLGVFVIVGLAGGAGGVRSDVPSLGDGVVYDGNGNIHYVLSEISDRRILTTDGETRIKQPDGTWR